MVGEAPLTGIKVLEFAGLAPGPFAGLLLADAGASVLRIDRALPGQTHGAGGATTAEPTEDMLARHKASVAVNLKDPAGVSLVRTLARRADVVIDPFRPGVLERLGLGPDVLCADNPRLIYGRMTGFRRDGKYAKMAGHDINYLAVSGALGLLGRKGEKPTPPWNILGDFAGGGAVLFQGVLMAVIARARTGRGQVVEANMVDGSAYLATFPRYALKNHLGDRPRGENLLDTGCPYYDTYETRDAGSYMAVGALEPHFYAQLCKGLEIPEWADDARRSDRRNWPELRRVIESRFRSRTRAEWEAVFDGTDACCTPVLGYREMEGSAAKEGDQRPVVTLRETPCLAVHQGATDVSQGQGPGIPGSGYEGSALSPGKGGEERLKEWAGWARGRDYEVSNGGLVLRDRSRL